MYQLKQQILAATGLFLLAVASPRAAAQNVTIVGPFPLPVAVNGTANVKVTNTVPVRDVTALGAVHGNASISIPDGTIEKCDVLYSVPAGNRLTIEYAGAKVGLPGGQAVRHIQFTTVLGGNHNLTFNATGVFNETIAGQTVKLYADGPSNVNVCVARSANAGSANFYPQFSGYLTPTN
jgi:hypothetical protein